MEKILITLVLLGYVSATPEQFRCPDVKSAVDLNITALGTDVWYGYARYPSQLEKEARCYAFVSQPTYDGIVKIRSANRSDYSIDFLEVVPEKTVDKDIIFSVTYGLPSVNIKMKIKTLFVDYDKYALFYNCRFDDAQKIYREYAWLQTKSKHLEPDDEVTLEELIKSSTILDIHKFIWADYSQKPCRMVKRATL